MGSLRCPRTRDYSDPTPVLRVTGNVSFGRIFDVVYDAERGEEPWWVHGAGESSVCLCACLCLPVPVPVAGLSMPDIISSKAIRSASSSWGDTGIPRRCHPVWYIGVHPLYSVVPTRISGIGFFSDELSAREQVSRETESPGHRAPFSRAGSVGILSLQSSRFLFLALRWVLAPSCRIR